MYRIFREKDLIEITIIIEPEIRKLWKLLLCAPPPPPLSLSFFGFIHTLPFFIPPAPSVLAIISICTKLMPPLSAYLLLARSLAPKKYRTNGKVPKASEMKPNVASAQEPVKFVNTVPGC